MIHTLDTKAADYIPELGDGFEEGSEGSENAQGLQVADYYADADGEGIYYITYKIETAKEIEQLFVFAGRKQLLRLGKRKAGEVIEGTLYLHFGEMIPRFHSECMTITKIGFSVACEDLTKLKSVGMAAEKLSAKTLRRPSVPSEYTSGIYLNICSSMCKPRLLIRLVKSHICGADATVHGDSALHILSEEVQPLIIRRTADLPQKPFVMRDTTIS